MPDFYPDIYQYLGQLENNKSVSSAGLEEMIYYIRAQTGLDYDTCSLLIKYFFQEIRNSMLNGEQVFLKGLGKLYISSPRTLESNRQAVFASFKNFESIKKKINNNDDDDDDDDDDT